MVAPSKLVKLQDIDFSAYDEIIDARTPHEFVEDHLPGAISLPVLDDAEHAEVGTMYKQVSPFDARKYGGALVSTNVGHYLKTHFADKPRSYRPLIYCWRGGQRSNSFALVLTQVGWPVDVVEGGYKAFRSFVRQQLVELTEQFSFKILVGLTGSGKTHLLTEMGKQGHQILDLEGAANHQGSLLGQVPDQQVMKQKGFETRLWHRLAKLDPSRPVWVEGESSKIGKVYVPQPLFAKLCASPSYEILVPLMARVQHIIDQYPHWTQNPDGLMILLSRLKPRHGSVEIDHWQSLAGAGDWQELVKRLLERHYDQSYLNSRGHLYGAPVDQFDLPSLAQDDMDAVIQQLVGVGG